MEESFKPLSLTIGELFGNKDALYKIPQYQRPYKWDDDPVEKLWDDIFEAFDNKEDNYFLGSIITAKPRDEERSTYVDVVDGQQRLTTLMILFCVIRDVYPTINEESAADNTYAVDYDTLSASISHLGKADRLKLYTHSQHQSDFHSLIIKGDTKDLKKPYKYQIRTDEEPKFKFINTAVILREKLLALGQEGAAEFINYLFNHVIMIRIDCNDRGFAIKLFQVLNDRGMDLTAADLIKSFLLEKLYSKYKDDSDTSKLKEEQFIADWRDMEQTIKTCDISLNDLFIIYETRNPAIYSFWYIRWSMYWKSILLTALHTDYANFEKLVLELRRFYYLYWIAGKTLSQIKQTSFNLIKWIKEGRPISEISYDLNEKLTKDNIVTQALYGLQSEQIASEFWCKPLLIMMEYNATDDSKASFIELRQDLHLEHILPVKYAKFSEWGHISKEVASAWLNSAGNLTLLSGVKNIEASNNPFETKISVYKGKGKYDTKDEKITAFAITQQIVQNYNSGKHDKNWNLQTMKDRWVWFFREAGELLEIDVTEAIEKHEPSIV